MEPRPTPAAPRPPDAAPARPTDPRELRRCHELAWRAWATTPNRDLARRLAGWCEGLPPWLRPGPWAAFGLLPGAVVGVLLALLMRASFDAAPWVQGVLVLGMTVYVSGALAWRDRREGGREFHLRLAGLLLHLPFTAAALGAGLLLIQGFSPWAIEQGSLGGLVLTAGCLAVALAVSAIRVTTPRALMPDPAASVWPPTADMPSIAFRVVTAGGVTLLVAPLLGAGSSAVVAAIAVALVTMMTAEYQERLAVALVKLLRAGRSLRDVPWPTRLAPPPFAVEAALLALADSPEAREKVKQDDGVEPRALAADYCDWRDYDAPSLDRAMSDLSWEPRRRRERARAAAICALELCCNRELTAEAAWRGQARLEAIAERHAEALDKLFWDWFGDAARETPFHVRGLRLLARNVERLPFGGVEAWNELRRHDWTAALEHAEAADRWGLIDDVLALHADLAKPDALAQALRDLDLWREAHPEQAWLEPAELWRRALPAVDAARAGAAGLAGDGDAPVGNNHPAYSLELRRRGWAAAADPAAAQDWYAAARRFESLPEVRQDELLPPVSYWELWRRVLATLDDTEELARQRERYRIAARRFRQRRREPH